MKKILPLLMCFIFCCFLAKADNEPANNAPGTTTDVLPLNGSQGGTIGTTDTDDYYQLATNADGTISISLSNADNAYTYIYLYDSDGTTQLGAISGYAASGISFAVNGLAKGNYFVLVHYTQSPVSTYTLSNTLSAQAIANDAEPDDMYTQGAVIAQNGSKTGHIGYRSNGGAVDVEDFYKLTTTVDGNVTINLSNDDNAYSYIYLYDNDGNALLGSSSNYALNGTTFTANGLSAGTYYIRVHADNNSGYAGYTISNTVVTPALANDAEPDDIFSQGATIAANGSKTGHIGYRYNGGAYDNDDYYKLVSTIDGNITINISDDNSSYEYIYLYDSDGSTLLNSASGYSTTTFTVNGLSAGTYYVKVHSDNTQFGAYTLSNVITPATLANDAEPNDLFTQALTIAPNGSRTGHIGYRYNGGLIDGDDYYKLVTTTDGNIGVNVVTDINSYTYIYLLDNDGTTQLGAASGYAQPGVPLNVNALAAGTYYIRVHVNDNSSYSSYTLTNTSSATITNETEPNNLFRQAITLNENDSAKGHIGYRLNGGSYDNDDVYKLVTSKDGNISISLNNDNNNYTYIYLYDKDTIALLGSSSGYAQNGTAFTVNGLAAGTYYVRVHVDNTSYSSYTLYDNIAAAAYTNDLEPNDDFTTATTLNNDSAKSGHISYRFNGGAIDNNDYRKVIMYTSGTLGITLAMANTNYSYVYLFDPAQNQIYSQSGYNTGYTIDFPTLAAGTYYLQVHADNSSFNSYKITRFNVPCNTDASAITAGGPLSFCQGGSVTLNSTIEYASYLWSNGATSRSISVNASGTYTLTGTDYDGCATHMSNSITVTVNPIPATPTIATSGPTSFCAGGSVTLTSSAGATYLWSTGATTPSIAVNASGNYTVQVFNAGGCASTASAVTTITVNALPATPAIIAGGPTSFCAGGNVTLTSSSATNNLWSTGATTASIIVTGSGNYTVQVSNANGCSATSAITAVTVNPLPATPTILAGSATTFCAGGSVMLTSSAATNNVWSNSATTQSITVNATGNYSVTVSNANGCSATSAATAVTVNPLPTVTLAALTTVCSTDPSFALSGGSPAGGTYSGTGVSAGQFDPATAGVGVFPITYSYTNGNDCTAAAQQSITVSNCTAPCNASISAGGPVSFCPGGSVTLTASVGASYLWSNGATTPAITVTGNGNYSCAVTNASNCTATSNVITVTVNAAPATPIINAGGATTFCAGGSVILTSNSATNNLWSNGATTASITVNASGTYTVTVSNANGCSATSAATTVTVNPLPTVALAPLTAVCSTDPAFALTGGSPAGGTYSGTGVSNGQFNPATAGVGSFPITYSYTNGNGCTNSAQQSIMVNNCTAPCLASISAGSATSFCAGGSVTLTASAGAGYLWSNGATTASITVTNSGNYSCAVTNASNCTATSNVITVTVNATPAIPAIIASGATSFCAGGSVTLTSSSTTNNLWSNDAITQAINVNASGTYTVTVSNANGCSATSAGTTVTVNPLPTVMLTAFASVCNTAAAFALTGGTPAGGTYSGTGVSGGQFSPAVAGVGTVDITYTYTNTNGCSAVAKQPIMVTNCSTCTASVSAGGPTTFCRGGNVVLTASAGTTYLWSNGATTQGITVTSSGSYTVTVTTGNCSATSAAVQVTVNVLPTVPTIAAGGPTTFCQGGTVTLTASTANSYAWSNGATSQSITVTASGAYTVTVKNTSGCAATSAATTVTVNNCGGTYCNANGLSKAKGYIHNVYLRNIFNTSGFSTGGYGNYLDQSASLTKGNSYLINVAPGFSSIFALSGLYTRVWIDWNQDGDFDDAGELVFAPVGASLFSRTGIITVPHFALTGQTRMRVEMRAGGTPTSCGSFAYGEVEDYTIVVGSGFSWKGGEPSISQTQPELSLTESFNLYPNPVSEELVIQRQGADNSAVVNSTTAMQIVDANGRMVLKASLTKSTEVIDVRRLPSGIYFVQLKTDNNLTTKKIIIAH